MFSDKRAFDISDPPPCKRPLLEHPSNIETNIDCDKYSFRPTNLRLPSEPLSLSLPPNILPTENLTITNIKEKDNVENTINEIMFKNSNNKLLSQKDGMNEYEPNYPSSDRKIDVFKSINHVSIITVIKTKFSSKFI